MSVVEVVTPSYNKGKYISDAIQSVLSQTFKDWHYTIIENSTDDSTRAIIDSFKDPRITVIHEDVPDELRRSEYIPAVLLNRYMPELKGDYFAYLSDDDIFDPACFQMCINNMTPDRSVVYFSMNVTAERDDGSYVYVSTSNATTEWAVSQNMDCMIDGGQAFMRRAVLDSIPQPYFETQMTTASHCDGLFLTKVAKQFKFYPIPSVLLTHRRTKLSAWVRS